MLEDINKSKSVKTLSKIWKGAEWKIQQIL